MNHMETMRQHRHRPDGGNESTSLLQESRGGSRYQATTAGGGPSRGHARRGYLPPLASLVAIGVAVAVTVAAAVVHFSSPGDQPYSQQEEPTTSFTSKNIADVPQAETSRSIPISSLRNDVHKEDGSRRSNRDGGGGGGGGGGGEGGVKKKQSKVQEERAPNVIFILVDDVGMNDMGPSSTDMSVATPFIDSLAVDGVRLSRYYTNHLCTPARASLMTGRDTFRTGMQFEELDNSMPWGVPLDEVTIADRFKAAGYATHMVGKWNLGMSSEGYYPFNRGFDTFLGYMGPEEDYYSHARSEPYFTLGFQEIVTFNDFGFGDKDGYIDYTTNTTRKGLEYEGVYSTTLTGDRAIEIASEHQAANEAAGTDDPLFMYLAFQAAHCPLDELDESSFTEEQLANLALIESESPTRLLFAKIVYFLDITIERVINNLDAMGMMDNTLVVVASDNGGCPSSGGSNFPYRGFKQTLFEGGVRTQALVYSKSDSIIPLEVRGTLYDGMMHVTDWTPTLANITGIPTVGMGKELSGFDHWSAIIGDRPESSPPVRSELVLGRNSYVFDADSASMIKTANPRGAYIYDGWKINVGDKCTGWFSFNPTEDLLLDPQCDVGECPTCTDGCHYVDALNNTFLFNIETDPFEIHNLVDKMPEKFEEMVTLWNKATVDEVKSNFLPEDPKAIEMWESFNNWTVAWL